MNHGTALLATNLCDTVFVACESPEPDPAAPGSALLRSLRTPRRLRDALEMRLRDALDPMTDAAGASLAASMVLDGALRVETEHGFASGIDAFPALADAMQCHGALRAPPLTMRAIRYGEMLLPMDESRLAARLYRYHAVPATPRLCARFSSRAAVEQELGIDRIDGSRDALANGWTRAPMDQNGAAWMSWSRTPGTADRLNDVPIYKLYISADVGSIGDAAQRAFEVLLRSDAIAFKTGANVYAILRPDSFIAYFLEFEHLARCADELRTALGRTKPHGVPFTAPLDECGLLSWGRDTGVWSETNPAPSWRQRIAARIAHSLVLTQHKCATSARRAEFALLRVWLDGVDPATMAPAGETPGPG